LLREGATSPPPSDPGLFKRPEEKPESWRVCPKNLSHYRGAVGLSENKLRTEFSGKPTTSNNRSRASPPCFLFL
jgi:hypothetical protein